MNSKTFISLYFSDNALQALAMSASKKKVLKFLSVELPVGLIQKQKVVDVKALTEIIKGLWKKLGLKELSVGIVIPEFSTFIKNINLPILEANEIDEAVRWQAQEFLPKSIDNMILDWKLIRKTNEFYQILTIAVDKEVLSGYVDAVTGANLYPVVVETPSLCLVKLTTYDKKPTLGKLIIYVNHKDTLLVIAEGEKIIGSSVVNSMDANSIVKTASQIIRHYSDITIEKVYLGGSGVDEALFKNISSVLNYPFEKLNIGVAGLSDIDIQNYLIAIALTLKEPKDPSDEDTINLLPDIVVKKYESKKANLQITTLLMVVTFLLWSSFLAVLGTYIFLFEQNLKYEKANADKLNVISKIDETRSKVKKINSLSSKVLKTEKINITPQIIFNSLNDAKNVGIYLYNFKFDFDMNSFYIKGIASTRLDLLTFKQALESTSDFENVQIPISSYESESDIDFELTFRYGPILRAKLE